MRTFYLFRSNLRNLETYHQIKDLEEFKLKCWDHYLLQGIWFLENNIFDRVIVWRLKPKDIESCMIVFNVNGKEFIQIFVDDFKDCFSFGKPEVSFFRGGFKEYCEVTKLNPKFFGLKLYLGAGRRVFPQYGGVYDKILVESDDDNNPNYSVIPFYKTANSNIFYPIESLEKEYDLCIISNFEQLRFKGQELLIKNIGMFKNLKSLKVVHIGNKPDEGMKLCRKYGVINIDFKGPISREEINITLNKSKFGVVASDESDGCPRVITEIMMSGTPLLLRNRTRLLKWYKDCKSVLVFNDNNLDTISNYGLQNYNKFKDFALEEIDNFSMKEVCKKNLELWK